MVKEAATPNKFSSQKKPESTPKTPLLFSPLRRGKKWFHQRFDRSVEEVYVGEDTKKTLLPTGRAVIEGIKNDVIRDAKKHSVVQTYSFDMDVVGREVIAVERKAAQDNPRVRRAILVDNSIAFWNKNGTVRKKNPSAREGKEETFEVLNDLHNEGTADVRVTNWFHILPGQGASNIFYRDHKKIAVADGRVAIVGSANIGEHHEQWLDIGVKFEGPVAEYIEKDVLETLHYTGRWRRVYDVKSAWEYFRRHTKELLRPDHLTKDFFGALIRNPQKRGRKTIIHSPSETVEIGTDSFFWPYREATRMAYQMIEGAKKGDTVDIVTPYPGISRLTKRLVKATRQGAEVNLHIPANNNYALYNPERAKNGAARVLFKAAMWGWKHYMKKKGIHLFEYQGDEVSKGMIHAKAVSLKHIDGTQEVLIGSMNLAMGLFAGSNREIGIKIQDKKFADEFNTKFLNVVKQQSKNIF